jgi:hypothetical protein
MMNSIPPFFVPVVECEQYAAEGPHWAPADDVAELVAEMDGAFEVGKMVHWRRALLGPVHHHDMMEVLQCDRGLGMDMDYFVGWWEIEHLRVATRQNSSSW